MIRYHFIFLLLPFFLNAGSCSATGNADTQIAYVGSTPGNDLTKRLLTIPPDTKVDFIRWNLTLNTMKSDSSFLLVIVFGESQPNTLDFKRNGEKLTFMGEYLVSNHKTGNIHGEIYRLKSSQLPAEIAFVKLNDNLFHLLTPQNRLMTGNGGWSYTLNRQQIINNDSDALPVFTTSSNQTQDTMSQVIFEGRTPCQELSADLNWQVSPSCFKLKWRIVLNRDPVSHEPTTYTMRKVVDNILQDDLSGNWKVISGIPGNPEAVIYQLDPETPDNSISFLAGDGNVIFFLTRDYKLRAGNADFSFTLNKKEPQE